MESNKISRKRVIKSLFWVYCENIAAQLVSFIVTIVLARLLEPGDYGSIALVTVFINIANVFVTSGFNMSLVQKKNADSLDYNTIFWTNFIIAIILYGVLFWGAPLIGIYYNNKILDSVIRILALRIPLSAYNSVQTAYVSNKMIFKKSFLSTSLGALLSGIFGICLAYLGAGIWALVAQSISTIIFNTVFLAVIVEWKPRCEFSIDRLRSLASFGWRLLVTGLMFTGYSELRTLVIGKRYTAEQLGYYNKGCQFPQFVASNIDTTITRVMFPALSKNQDNLVDLKKMTRRAAKTSAFIMTPVLFGLAVVADNLVVLLLTDKWTSCVPYMQIMCIVWWLQPTQSCSIQAVKAIGRSDLYLRIEVISKIFGISLLFISILIFDTPFAIAISMLIGQMFAMALYGINVSKTIKYKLGEQILDLIIPALLGCVMGTGVYFVGRVTGEGLKALLAQVMTGAVIYVGLAYIFKVEEFIYLLSIILKLKRRK